MQNTLFEPQEPTVDLRPSVSGAPLPPSQSHGEANETNPALASLDTEETSAPKPHGRISCMPAVEASDERAIEFRHGGWFRRRAQMLQALEAAGVSQGRLNRFNECGSHAWLLKNAKGDLKVAASHCHDRFCLPCVTAHRHRVARNLAARVPHCRLRLMTLTLKGRHEPLRQSIARLITCWKTLRRQRYFAQRILGGIQMLEITRNDSTGLWHPHLHIVYQGDFIAHAKLAKEWRAVTGDSFIVDVRQLKTTQNAIAYVCKYAGKAIANNIWDNTDALHECIRTIKSVRSFQTFGTWRALALCKPDTAGEDWQAVEPLYVTLEAAARGDERATFIIRSLSHVRDELEPPNQVNRSP